MTTEKIAEVAHEVNRAYCKATGDSSQPAWEDAPGWQKESSIAGVKAHLERARTPEESHELWLEQKRKDGWKFGPVKDPEKKEHPCFMPYAQLPESQRAKDYLFGAVVAALKTDHKHGSDSVADVLIGTTCELAKLNVTARIHVELDQPDFYALKKHMEKQSGMAIPDSPTLVLQVAAHGSTVLIGCAEPEAQA